MCTILRYLCMWVIGERPHKMVLGPVISGFNLYTNLLSSRPSFSVLGFELRALLLLGRCSIACAISLALWFLKCGPQASGMSITCKHIRNTNFGAPSQTHRNRKSEMRPSHLYFQALQVILMCAPHRFLTIYLILSMEENIC
jgi:hypothetical protein